jgi:hypothetical protein
MSPSAIYFGGLVAAVLMLWLIVVYDHKKEVPIIIMLVVIVLWPILLPAGIILGFTRFNRIPAPEEPSDDK